MLPAQMLWRGEGSSVFLLDRACSIGKTPPEGPRLD